MAAEGGSRTWLEGITTAAWDKRAFTRRTTLAKGPSYSLADLSSVVSHLNSAGRNRDSHTGGIPCAVSSGRPVLLLLYLDWTAQGSIHRLVIGDDVNPPMSRNYVFVLYIVGAFIKFRCVNKCIHPKHTHLMDCRNASPRAAGAPKTGGRRCSELAAAGHNHHAAQSGAEITAVVPVPFCFSANHH